MIVVNQNPVNSLPIQQGKEKLKDLITKDVNQLTDSNTQLDFFTRAYLKAKPIIKEHLKGTVAQRVSFVLNNHILTVSQIATKSKTTINDVTRYVFELKRSPVFIVHIPNNGRDFYFITASKGLYDKATKQLEKKT